MYDKDFILQLADEYGEDPETIQKAFWLQEHIKEEGIDAVRFMRKSSAKMRASAPSLTEEEVTSELKKRLE